MHSQLISIIDSSITKSIDDFIDIISKKYNLNSTELKDIWMKNNTQSKSQNTKSSPIVKNSSTGSKCIYVFTKGVKEGEKCGTGVSNGGEYCSKHKKKETEPKVEPKSEPKVESKSETKVEKDKEVTVKKDVTKIVSKSPKQIDFVKLKDSKFDLYHSEQLGFVIKTKSSKDIIGKYIKSLDFILPLNKDDLTIIKKYKLNYEVDKYIEYAEVNSFPEIIADILTDIPKEYYKECNEIFSLEEEEEEEILEDEEEEEKLEEEIEIKKIDPVKVIDTIKSKKSDMLKNFMCTSNKIEKINKVEEESISLDIKKEGQDKEESSIELDIDDEEEEILDDEDFE